jgi:hypothetical protein
MASEMDVFFRCAVGPTVNLRKMVGYYSDWLHCRRHSLKVKYVSIQRPPISDRALLFGGFLGLSRLVLVRATFA